MDAKEILKYPSLVLSQSQREAYFENGYLLLPGFVKKNLLTRIRMAAAEFVEQSRACIASDTKFDLQPGHTKENPKLLFIKDNLTFITNYSNIYLKFPKNRY